jgi:hypothetical protein
LVIAPIPGLASWSGGIHNACISSTAALGPGCVIIIKKPRNNNKLTINIITYQTPTMNSCARMDREGGFEGP